MLYNVGMKKSIIVELPGYVTVAGAADRLRLASRSVRDLIYIGRLPSTRLGHRHFLRILDVETERRRRLGLPLPRQRSAGWRRRARRQPPDVRQRASSSGEASIQPRAAQPTRSEARRERAAERAAQLDRWLHSGHGPETPALPFT